MAAVIWWQFGELRVWVDASATHRAVRLCWLVFLGMAVYGVAMLAGGLRKHHLEKGAS
jgi:peptidoglycan biosynthesis protein MviN/MurJ (putative lipid II flippase)